MGKGSFWVIDGVKVKKKNPFIFQTVLRPFVPEKEPHEKQGESQVQHVNHINAMTNEEMVKNFFADNIEDLPNSRIDYDAFRNSASSLRDFYLFGPPPLAASRNQLYYHSEEQFTLPSGPQVRKNIFMNEFIGFVYSESSN